jgi:hypothetical protein
MQSSSRTVYGSLRCWTTGKGGGGRLGLGASWMAERRLLLYVCRDEQLLYGSSRGKLRKGCSAAARRDVKRTMIRHSIVPYAPRP